MESEDSNDIFMSNSAFVERYFEGPSYHRAQAQEGGGADIDDDDVQMPGEASGALPILNADDPEDFQGSPISKDQYIDIPLSPEYAKLISVKIKRTSFVRQKVSTFKSNCHAIDSFSCRILALMTIFFAQFFFQKAL